MIKFKTVNNLLIYFGCFWLYNDLSIMVLLNEITPVSWTEICCNEMGGYYMRIYCKKANN